MTANKRTLHKPKFHSTQASEPEISWSSSESDSDECILQILKKRKVSTVSSAPVQNKCDNTEFKQIVDLCNYHGSPVIGLIEPDQCSPTLTKETNSLFTTSPVIGKTRNLARLRKIKRNFSRIKSDNSVASKGSTTSQNEFRIETEENSPDLFSSVSQSTYNIDNCSQSPEQKNQINISPVESQKPANICILPFPSQDSTEISTSIPSSNSITSKSSSDSLYYEVVPKKKRYKKNGLAYRLQKCLRKQKSSVGIWHHEHYLNKGDFSVSDKCVKLKVNEMSNEYGSVVLKCNYLDDCSENTDPNTNSCTVIIGHNNVVNTTFKPNCIFKLYEPYQCKRVKCKEGEFITYYNVCKLLLCSE